MSDAPEVHAPHAPDVKAGLGKKLGPLPMGVWILAIGGGLVLAYVMRSRSSAADSTSTDTTAADDWNYGTSNGVGQTDTGSGTTSSGTTSTPITTNEQWQSRAVSILVGRLYDPVTADRAIGKYLAGESLTTVERAIVNEAIIALGPPPISPPPPSSADSPPPVVTPPPVTKPPTVPVTPVLVKPQPVTKPPAAKPPAKPVTVAKPPATKTVTKTYTIQHGDTLSGIASKLHISMATLKAYNPVFWTVAKYNNGNTIWAGGHVKYPVTVKA